MRDFYAELELLKNILEDKVKTNEVHINDMLYNFNEYVGTNEYYDASCKELEGLKIQLEAVTRKCELLKKYSYIEKELKKILPS